MKACSIFSCMCSAGLLGDLVKLQQQKVTETCTKVRFAPGSSAIEYTWPKLTSIGID